MTSPGHSASGEFATRHIGVSETDQAKMLAEVGYPTSAGLMDAAVPSGIRSTAELNLPAAATEAEARAELHELAGRNTVAVPMIGLGYHATTTPAVIRRNVLEDPAWYTAYTPYQPEISQGRLEALINFQTMVGDLTGLPTANASLLDEGTAVAEAVTVMRRVVRGGRPRVLVDGDTLPQTLSVLRTRAAAVGTEVVEIDVAEPLPEGTSSGWCCPTPAARARSATCAG